MDKFLIPFLTLGLAVLVSSCSDNDEPAVSGGNAPANTVAIICQVPTNSIYSRGADANGFYGDGAEATHLVYVVYNENGEIVLSSDEPGAPLVSLAGGKFTVYINPNINNGRNYTYLFVGYFFAPEERTDQYEEVCHSRVIEMFFSDDMALKNL